MSAYDRARERALDEQDQKQRMAEAERRQQIALLRQTPDERVRTIMDQQAEKLFDRCYQDRAELRSMKRLMKGQWSRKLASIPSHQIRQLELKVYGTVR